MSRYQFRDCLLDTSRRELRVRGVAVALQPRTFDLLVHLVAHAGQAVAKDDLIAAVWPTSHVTDAVLTTAMTRVRRAIGDQDSEQPIVRTLHGVGYRFDAQVQAIGPDAREPHPAAEATPLAPAAGPSLVNGGLASPTAPSNDSAMLRAEPGIGFATDAEFWASQWQRGLDLVAAGAVEQALNLLWQVRPHLPDEPEHALVLAPLLRQRLRLAEAGAELRLALQRRIPAPAGRTRARLLMEAARINDLRQEVAQGLEACDQVIDLVTAGEAPRELLNEALALSARLHYMRADYVKVNECVEQVESAAVLPQDAPALIAVWLQRGRLMFRQGQPRAAMDQMLQALRMAESHGLPMQQADAYSALTLVLENQHRYGEQVAVARRAITLVGDHTDLTRRDRARTEEVFALLEAGRLDEAGELLPRYLAQARVAESAISRYNLGRARAEWLWRTGRLEAGLEVLQDLLLEFREWTGFKVSAATAYALRSLSMGVAEPAQALLDEDSRWLTSSAQALVQAALLLAQGNRDAARAQLRRGLISGRSGGAYGWDVALSLAFMMVEDGQTAGLDEVLQIVRDTSGEHSAVALLEHLLQLRQGERRFEAESFQRLVRANHGLVNRHAWLLDITQAQSWAQPLSGTPPRMLGELFSCAWM